MCPRFSFVIALTAINKVNDFRVPRGSQVKYKILFLIDFALGIAVVVEIEIEPTLRFLRNFAY